MGLLGQLWATLIVINVFTPFFICIHRGIGLRCSHSIMLNLKKFTTKVLLGCAFAKFVIMASGVGLICSAGVEDILVVFSCTDARSIIVEEP
jgi:hypothetical protein